MSDSMTPDRSEGTGIADTGISVDLGGLYAASRRRIDALVRGEDPQTLHGTPVAACPGWSVHDTVAHLVGVVEDAIEGKLSGPPDPVITAAEVERHRDRPMTELLDVWASLAPMFEDVVTQRQVWPAMFDVISHEQDIRTALGRRGARDEPAVVLAGAFLARLPARVPLRIAVLGREAAGGNAVATLTTSAFEVLRMRLGRRSIDQVLAMPWRGDPSAHLGELFVFGPALEPLDE